MMWRNARASLPTRSVMRCVNRLVPWRLGWLCSQTNVLAVLRRILVYNIIIDSLCKDRFKKLKKTWI
ncbi:hypothetical protein ACB092_11G258200 [Castanea dentata]